MKTRKSISKHITDAEWLLPGTIVTRYLKCRRKDCETCSLQGGHGPAYYLSVLGENKRTQMIYVPKEHLAEVRKATKAYALLRDGLRDLARADLDKWRTKRRKRQ